MIVSVFDITPEQDKIVVHIRFEERPDSQIPHCHVTISLEKNDTLTLEEIRTLAIEKAKKFLGSCIF